MIKASEAGPKHGILWWAGCFLSAALVGGCGGGGDGPLTYPVTGTVTMGGQPVADAIVEFTPSAPDGATAGAQARTDAEGKFEVSLILDMGKTTKRGLPEGEYRVTVVKLETGAGDATLSNRPRNTLPPVYSRFETTPLRAPVQPGGENAFPFELE